MTLDPNILRTHNATPRVITQSDASSSVCCHKNDIILFFDVIVISCKSADNVMLFKQALFAT